MRVLYGYGDYEELKNAGEKYIVEKLEDILEIFYNYKKATIQSRKSIQFKKI